jgi:hypothetical protein
MVLQAQDLLLDLYSQIKHRALSKNTVGTGTVMILVHPDLDGICSLRILAVRR